MGSLAGIIDFCKIFKQCPRPMSVKGKACVAMTKGSHGSTYGGNPLAMSVGLEKKLTTKIREISR